jgi:hypothetical protein
MLESASITESKYEDKLELKWEWLKQLAVITGKENKKMALR